ncbi:MAG: RusA family crossover junction endodeoxyribonuclease [Methanoregula sp.]
MNTYRITIPILPKAQKRDRIGSRGGHGFSYKDKSQKLEENKLLLCLMESKPPEPLSGAISLEVRVYLPIPKSKPRIWREKAERGEIMPTVKPDIDNYAKNLLDVMNGVYFQDDKQITDLTVSKRYTSITVPSPCWVVVMRGDY